MILSSSPQNQAVLSNVGEIGEFRIRNSAKAFSILSSGLYANKIRAIIRELSCNAVDSHVDAGKEKTPFDIHLPNTLEPWFSVRDYGTGLTHEQVVSIYTTYFESTKTGSNSFIGALGLGSKSPFAYTDNFTVTAVKDGMRGIYSAFINDQGVPSIALMHSEPSTDPNGVEVKFSVNDRWDFEKFKSEAKTVFTHFKLRPVVSGASSFQFFDMTYTDKDIIPGVHSTGEHRSIAIMGNIAYPIDVPSSDSNLGSLSRLLNCGLVMNFDIGELDFQASREGLSYIPETISAIKAKLVQVVAALSVRLASDANAFKNVWERAVFLSEKSSTSLWGDAVNKYVSDTKFDLVKTHYNRATPIDFVINEPDLASKFNIVIRGFQLNSHYQSISNLSPYTRYNTDPITKKDVLSQSWEIPLSARTYFVINDGKVGASSRAKYHWKTSKRHNEMVYVIEKSDKTKPVDMKGFVAFLRNPPEARFLTATSLLEKVRASTDRAKNVTILKLERKSSSSRYRDYEMVWRDAGKANTFDTKTKHYYMPLSGYSILSDAYDSMRDLTEDMVRSGLPGLCDVTVYGVRKGDIEFIKQQPNWINVETHIKGVLTTFSKANLISLAMPVLDNYPMVRYNDSLRKQITDAKSPFVVAMDKLKDVVTVSYSDTHLRNLSVKYNPQVMADVSALKNVLLNEAREVYAYYPLFKSLSNGQKSDGVAEYVNLINVSKKEIK